MSEQQTPPDSPMVPDREMTEEDIIFGKRILYLTSFIGAVLLVCLAIPQILERL